ncbi:hypothetical protein EJ06DRAFT_529030 [Trichodelitschia bisporula]|uniref:Uncharacterized protein n=1 Tax=Trichodelitschia bisporula TaxID=703511 RepID=A0A6G1I1D1_9PEZI|nr:hypothetical protein EJ06DRAFT_529030 [Trichodelitschia bisporula]
MPPSSPPDDDDYVPAWHDYNSDDELQTSDAPSTPPSRRRNYPTRRSAQRTAAPPPSQSWDFMETEHSDGDAHARNVRMHKMAEQISQRTTRIPSPPAPSAFIMPASPDGARNGSISSQFSRQREEGQRLSPAQRRALETWSRQGTPVRAQETPRRDYGRSPEAWDSGRAKRSRKTQQGSPTKNKPQDDTFGPNPLPYFLPLARNTISQTFGYMMVITGSVLGHLQPIISLVIAIGVILWGIRATGQHLTSMIPAPILSPCSLPFASYLPICAPSTPPSTSLSFSALSTAQGALADILRTTHSNADLPYIMKHSESSLRDLRHIVRYSQLPARNEIAHELDGFVDAARGAGAEVVRFYSHLGRAVDHVVYVNKHTMRILNEIDEAEAERGVVGRVVQSVRGVVGRRWEDVIEERLRQEYLLHSVEIGDHLGGLILEAQALLGMLSDLDARLDALSAVLSRSDIEVQGSHEELLAQLWTQFGGNRANRRRTEAQIALLGEVGRGKNEATSRVHEALLQLQKVQAEVEGLREDVGGVESVEGEVGPAGQIEGGERRTRRALPLEAHVKNMLDGVRRLEDARGEVRGREEVAVKRILGMVRDNKGSVEEIEAS